MGSLTPGTTYIYERSNGKVYSREVGSLNRRLIGWEADSLKNIEDENELWEDIRATAKENETLQKALESAIMLYRLIKKDPL